MPKHERVAGCVLGCHQRVTPTFATSIRAFAAGSPGSALPCAQPSCSSAATLAPSPVLMTPISRQGQEGGAPFHQPDPAPRLRGHSTHRREPGPSPCPARVPRRLPPCCSCVLPCARGLARGKRGQSSPCGLVTAGVPPVSVLPLSSWGTDSTASLAGTGRYRRLLIKMSFTGPLGDLN